MSLPTSTHIHRFAGWSAYLSAGLSIISGIFLFLFYGLEVPRMIATDGTASQTFGTLNDTAALFQFLCMLPLTVALHRLAPPNRQGLSLIGGALGAVGIVTVVIAQALLVAGALSFEVNLPVIMVGFVLLGVWMILANHVAQVNSCLPSPLTLLGAITGLAFAVMGCITLLLVLINWRDPSAATHLVTFVQQYPALIGIGIVLAIVGFLAFFFAVPLWLIWLGRRLFAMAIEPTPGKFLARSAVL